MSLNQPKQKGVIWSVNSVECDFINTMFIIYIYIEKVTVRLREEGEIK